jgi:hypothetical protein
LIENDRLGGLGETVREIGAALGQPLTEHA